MPLGTYKRGQIEWALWQFFARPKPTPDVPSKVFLTRIKRLLELDRSTEEFAESETVQVRYAFFDDEPRGQGADSHYTPFNAFCLGLALDMLDTGFKQSEVLFFLRHVVGDLENHFAKILRCPPPSRSAIRAKDRPECPSYKSRGGRVADCRLFMVTRKIELNEVYAMPTASHRSHQPVIIRPVYCWGIESLQKELVRMNASHRKAMVFELAHTAARVTVLLERAPVIKRVRK